MKQKIVDLLGSIRFWQLVGTGIVIWLQTDNWKMGIITILGGSVAVGSADSVAQNLSGTKK